MRKLQVCYLVLSAVYRFDHFEEASSTFASPYILRQQSTNQCGLGSCIMKPIVTYSL